MKTMKAIVASGYGSPDVYQVRNVAKPVPGAGEVLIKVYAASVTTADGMMRTGKPYFGRLMTGIRKPKHPIPGTGFAGVVEAVGEGVDSFGIGDRVFGETTLGFSTNAEYFTIPESGVILPLPENMKMTEAATFCDGPLTSWNFLKEMARVRRGQNVLINGASGSLGTAAVQLAKHLGARVTGVCSNRNIGLVKSLGADDVIDYTKEDFTEKNQTWDIIFDTVGKRSFPACKSVLSESGWYISPVLKFSLLRQMIWTSLWGKKKAKFSATGLRKDHELKKMLAELRDIHRDGRLEIVMDRQYPLEKVGEAHSYIASGHKKGNVVIVVSPEDL